MHRLLSRLFRKRAHRIPGDAATGLDAGLHDLLMQTLLLEGWSCKTEDGCVRLENGLLLAAQLMEQCPLASGGVRTSVMLLVVHEDAFPEGLTEFQHAWGDDAEQALRAGFRTWAGTDLVALADAVDDPRYAGACMRVVFDGMPRLGQRRTVILGPVLHLDAPPQDQAGQAHDGHGDACPCCLFSQAVGVLKRRVEQDAAVLGIRLFASRDPEGQAAADCRINGIDFDEGTAALRQYAATWQHCDHLQYRKQYAVVRTEAGSRCLDHGQASAGSQA